MTTIPPGWIKIGQSQGRDVFAKEKISGGPASGQDEAQRVGGDAQHAQHVWKAARPARRIKAPDEVEREADLHNDIMDYCRAAGWLALHGSTAHQTKRTLGEFDFVIFADKGRVYAIECKSRTGKLRPEQMALKTMLNVLGHGQRWACIRSMAEFIRFTTA